jgi:hypothetical protein
MEKEGKDRKRKGWRIGRKGYLLFGILIVMFVIRNPKANKIFDTLLSKI